MTVSSLRPHDRDDAVRLWSGCGLSRPWNDAEADYDRALEGPASSVLGVRDGSRLIGTVMVGHDGHRGWIYYLAVAPTHRGAGVARALMAAAEGWLADRSVPKLNLMVRADNADVIGFYESLGYETSDVRVLGRFLDR